MQAHLIARTKERESCSEDGVFWWKEYRLRKDKYDIWHLELRYLARVGDKIFARVDGKVALFTDPDSTWQGVVTGADSLLVIDEFMGDSDFYGAESLELSHVNAVKISRQKREESRRLSDAEKAMKEAWNAWDSWKVDQQRAFEKKMRGKPDKYISKAQERTEKRLKPEHDRLVANYRAAAKRYEDLTQKKKQAVSQEVS